MKWYFFASSVLSHLLSSFREWIFVAALLKNNEKKKPKNNEMVVNP